MAESEQPKAEKPYKLYRVYDGNRLGIALAEADKPEDLWKIHKRRVHCAYEIHHNRKKI